MSSIRTTNLWSRRFTSIAGQCGKLMHQATGFWKGRSNGNINVHAFKLNQPVPELQPVGCQPVRGVANEGSDPGRRCDDFDKPEDVFTCGLFSSTRGGFTMVILYRARNRAGREVELTVAGQEPYVFHRAMVGLLNGEPRWHGKF